MPELRPHVVLPRQALSSMVPAFCTHAEGPMQEPDLTVPVLRAHAVS
eukprot:CAMPEP_0198127778 /NCGR_PEP_ID=MMETSP1442-20131203/47951_1 /TAXON_ID= /ORGANISM="Craspedostauros australis, Strain CCMP3328" /LENGTH=46 /DNA_ID= /DNA_START= /DNA_END= /DNA_ORIENTATION=